jgi:hypothetical protein
MSFRVAKKGVARSLVIATYYWNPKYYTPARETFVTVKGPSGWLVTNVYCTGRPSTTLYGSKADVPCVGMIASGCRNETVTYGGKPILLRFELRSVSCGKAHSLIRTYFHDIATQTCREHGTACIFIYRGWWDCSFPIPALRSKALAGCNKNPGGAGASTASLSVYKIKQ